ncbi:[LysW]-aminoadipate semialdehyde/glutamate semialdehyde transaminase [uncultured archaeon]|nr:[LysW]-aminoadipate semialdehyde/glutamate semialdehyde transaminase [uncultured archaeon]
MKNPDIETWEKRVYANTFKRLPITLEKGEGPYVWDIQGKKYLDFYAGIGATSIGHNHPAIIKTITQQASKLIHTSNWVYTLPQLQLADHLIQISKMQKVFYTNSGTEAVEAAMKLARTTTNRKNFIAFTGSFHGRTLGAVSLTWTKKYREPFEPLIPGCTFIPYGDEEALKQAVDSQTAAVFIEAIQNESGIIEPPEGFLKAAREITEDAKTLLIADEVSTGFGRTGNFFAYQHEKIQPDAVIIAKAMGGGIPIGALLYQGRDFKPGEHGGTYGGNPLACAVAQTVLDIIQTENLTENSTKMGIKLRKELNSIGYKTRGRGLLLGIEAPNPEATVRSLIDEGVLTIPSDKVIRALPPLNIKDEHAQEFTAALRSITK